MESTMRFETHSEKNDLQMVAHRQSFSSRRTTPFFPRIEWATCMATYGCRYRQNLRLSLQNPLVDNHYQVRGAGMGPVIHSPSFCPTLRTGSRRVSARRAGGSLRSHRARAMCSCILYQTLCRAPAHPAPNFVQGVRRHFQPRTWTQTSPTPGLTLTLTLTPTLALTRTLNPTFWGGLEVGSRGSHAAPPVLVVFFF